MMSSERVGASFRDPSGFVFRHDGFLYRQVNERYRQQYDHLMNSGLYEHLVASGLLIPHEEVSAVASPSPEGAYKFLKPEMVPFISYPYEWCFSQLKDAALATLAVQKAAMQFGMTLKDASGYNIQFHRGRPVFIDTLSFDLYQEGEPWVPYKQFCQHFLAPLAMMSLTDIRLQRLLETFIDGIPIDVASAALPTRSRLSVPLLLHIHMHAKSQRRYADAVVEKSNAKPKMSRISLLGLIDSLEGCIAGLKWKPVGTEWAEYYSDDSYTPEAFEHKRDLVGEYLRILNPKVVWDLGANNGFHSRLAAEMGAFTLASDVDPACVERNYLQVKKSGESNLLPLLLDLTNPSPSIGWATDERASIVQRANADTAMALALIHHLAISNNVPFGRVASFFRQIANSLIIEFVPKSDHKVRKLLATREDVFDGYSQECFERDFGAFFVIQRSDRIRDSERVLYLMVGK